MRTFKFGLVIQNTETLKAIEVLFIGSITFSKILTQYPIMKMIEKDFETYFSRNPAKDSLHKAENARSCKKDMVLCYSGLPKKFTW